MTTFEELSDADKDKLLTWENLLRSATGALARDFDNLQWLATMFDSGVGDILADLEGDVPTSSGLAGIELKNGTELTQIQNGLKTMLAEYNKPEFKQYYLDLAGPINIINGD